MKHYIKRVIVLIGLIFLMTGGTVLAANGPTPATAASPIADDIRDIRGPLHIPDPLIWLYYAGGACLFLIIAAAAWRWFRRRKVLRAKLAFEIAFEQLERAKALMKPETADEFSVAVSDAVRTYIESRFDLRVTRHTTEEFMARIAAEPAGDLVRYADLLHHFLGHCDLAKFARYMLGSDQMKKMHQSAWEFVDKTKLLPEEMTADQDMEKRGENIRITTQSKLAALFNSLKTKGLNLIPKKTTAPVGLDSSSALAAGGR